MSRDIFYTTGAFIYQRQMSDGTWAWVVEQFEDDTFRNGEYIGVNEVSNTKEGLVDSDE